MSNTDLNHTQSSLPGRSSASEISLEASLLDAQVAAKLRTLRRGVGLAAAPVFATMAIISAVTPAYDFICASHEGGWSITGMTWMYCLMSFFHIDAWLRLLDQGGRPRHNRQQCETWRHD